MRPKLKRLVACALFLAALPFHSFADTNLAQRCDGVSVATQAAACTGSRTWTHPVAGDTAVYLSYPTVPADSTTIAWGDANLQFRPWVGISGTGGVLTCTKDIPSPSVIAVGGTDQCAPGNDAVAKVFVAASSVALATASTTIAVTGTVPLSWPASTTDTAGAQLTDLAGYNVYRGMSCSALAKVASVPTVTYTDSGLTVGTYCYAVTAVSTSEGESAQSPTLTVAFTPPTPLGKPNAPGSPTAQCTIVAPTGMKASCSVTP